MLGALADDALPPFAEYPDPGVRATALGTLRDRPRLHVVGAEAETA
ncbi:hypothetical protein [Streptomyces sp. NPDC059781]